MLLDDHDLLMLVTFLHNVEEHHRCRPIGSDTHGYYPRNCLEAILDRHTQFQIDRITEKLEREMVRRSS